MIKLYMCIQLVLLPQTLSVPGPLTRWPHHWLHRIIVADQVPFGVQPARIHLAPEYLFMFTGIVKVYLQGIPHVYLEPQV